MFVSLVGKGMWVSVVHWSASMPHSLMLFRRSSLLFFCVNYISGWIFRDMSNSIETKFYVHIFDLILTQKSAKIPLWGKKIDSNTPRNWFITTMTGQLLWGEGTPISKWERVSEKHQQQFICIYAESSYTIFIIFCERFLYDFLFAAFALFWALSRWKSFWYFSHWLWCEMKM